jgi:signal transduction histidine kinase/CheY-like chemotaxis protein
VSKVQSDRNALVYFVIAGMTAGIFFVDLVTRLGVVEWIFYIAPIGLCLLQARPLLPLVVAFAASVLTILGMLLSPEGVDLSLAQTNRAMGIVTIWFIGFLVRSALVTRERAARLAWTAEGQAQLATSALGDLRPEETATALLGTLARYVDAQVGVLYRIDGGALLRIAGFALPDTTSAAPVKVGDSMAGQVAMDLKPVVLHNIPGYLRIASGTGEAPPHSLVLAPITVQGKGYGVIELGFLRRFDDAERVLDFVTLVAGNMGVAIRTAYFRQRVDELLEETQRQSEELQAQQEELRVANEELEENGNALRESQARLETQQSELEETNAQLEAQTNDLERQKEQLLRVQAALASSAANLERASRYKSEFLANMSHELRTPLNSSLILAKVLADNAGGNLTDDQVGYAKTIQSSNNDLLALINDILDLSKIEAGHFELQPEETPVAEILAPLRATFEVAARQKRIEYAVDASPHLPATLTTDVRRLHQVLRNLLSNAFKFTDRGSVTLRVAPAKDGQIAFSVEDTGIGIPEDEQSAIFNAFHQVDGTASRRYGGTGLGLSISRELARLLGGAIDLRSTVGVGSVFTLTVPAVIDAAPDRAAGAAESAQPSQGAPQQGGPPTARPAGAARSAAAAASSADLDPPRPTAPAAALARIAHIDDDRGQRAHERLVLIVEDDPNFAKVLYGLAHELDLDCVHTALAADAPTLARELKPSGILLDVDLPDGSGLAVLERLKRDPVTRHIPVHMISVEDHTQPALELGAIGYTLKPAAREQLAAAIEALKDRSGTRTRKVLIVEDDVTLRQSIAVLLSADDVAITLAGSVNEALEKLAAEEFDCMVMDLALPDASGFELLEKIRASGTYASPPVIVYTGRALTPADEQRLRRYSRSIIIKGARSPERLLDEVTLFLHRVESTLPPDQQKLLRQARQRDAAFEGRTILLAEDDVRNIFALTSVLEPLGAKLEIARNGREAVERLHNGKAIDLVLMDIMMPEMDGLAATRAIREMPEGAQLPIIAITAKAMPEDRQACLAAGASDYISKPIDVDRLISLCRVWMPK